RRLRPILQDLRRVPPRRHEPVGPRRPYLLELRATPPRHEVGRAFAPGGELGQRIIQGPPGEPAPRNHVRQTRLRGLDLIEDLVECLQRRHELLGEPFAPHHHGPNAARRAATIVPGSFVAIASTPARISATASAGSSLTQVPSRSPPSWTRSAKPTGAASTAPAYGNTHGCPCSFANVKPASASTERSVNRPVGIPGARSRQRAIDDGLKLETISGRSKPVASSAAIVASMASSRSGSKSGSPGTFLISMSAAAGPARGRR